MLYSGFFINQAFNKVDGFKFVGLDVGILIRQR